MMLLFLLSVSGGVIHSQERRSEYSVDYRVNITRIDSLYSDNSSSLRDLRAFLSEIGSDRSVEIVSVSFCGAASPEGSYELNRRLARSRLASLERIVRSELEIPDSVIFRDDSYIPWDYLKSRISESELPDRDAVLSILAEEPSLVSYHRPDSQIDHRIVKLRQLDSGRTWREIHRQYFSRMRNACVVFVTYRHDSSPLPRLLVIEDSASVGAPASLPSIVPDTTSVPDGWTRRLHVKTNAIGLGLGMANAAVEVDLCRHLSFALPVYYSAWNYFRETLKFRTLSFQPELRCWLSPDNRGFYAGAHFGLSYYNFAFGGAHRYQDHDGTTPALGGGLSVGYRLPLTSDGRWNVEFSLGAGAYGLHYDRFHNTSSTRYGLLIDSVRDTYIGIDQAGVTFSYSFGLEGKGGRK